MQRRIVSLVPSLTETIAAMGLGDELVGITHFCVRPRGLRATVVGGTKNVDTTLVKSLQPTHVLAVKEENVQEQIEQLSPTIPVLVLEPKKLSDVPPMLTAMHAFLHVESTWLDAKDLRQKLVAARPQEQKRKALYLVWHNPAMAAGKDTYIDSCLSWLGYENVLPFARYPEIDYADYQNQDIDILLATEPFAFRKRQARTIREIVGPIPHLYRIDGRLMSWYGAATWEMVARTRSELIGDQLA